jgi:phosphatidylserine/phosphatidylglycerophosphate/cardiolipin synthase-like enzyme
MILLILFRWFIGGEDYFRSLITSLENAKKRILITGWYFAPGLLLSRKDPLSNEYRVDKILERKSKEVFIVVFFF